MLGDEPYHDGVILKIGRSVQYSAFPATKCEVTGLSFGKYLECQAGVMIV
jgi:hypothetical protein